VIVYGDVLINGGILITKDNVYELYVGDRIRSGYSLMFITFTIILLVFYTVQVCGTMILVQRGDGQHVLADD
jgi:hypothetical protein